MPLLIPAPAADRLAERHFQPPPRPGKCSRSLCVFFRSTKRRAAAQPETHILAAIVHVAEQGVETPWPLEIEAHDGSMYNVLLKVGESLIYESARLAHSRATPLDGEMYLPQFQLS